MKKLNLKRYTNKNYIYIMESDVSDIITIKQLLNNSIIYSNNKK